MAHLVEYVTEYRWPDESADEPEKLSTDEYKHVVKLDKYDRAEGLTAVDLAVTVLDKGGVIEASTSPRWSRNTWYVAESYTHPYTGVTEERTFHLHGFTADEQREIYRRIVKR